jgi:transposase
LIAASVRKAGPRIAALVAMTTCTGSRRPTDWREGRRLRAWELNEQGWTQRAIARALGVTEGAVSQWCTRARDHGAEALRRRITPGSAPKLPAERLAQLPAFLTLGAEAFGFQGQVWTTRRVAAVLERVFGVRYHPGARQPAPPGRRLEPAEARAARHPARRGRDPRLARRGVAGARSKARAEGRTVVRVDESGFYPLPAVARTFAPRGHTPVLPVPPTHDHLSAISAITPAGRLFLSARPQSIRGPDVVRFLKHLLRLSGAQIRFGASGAHAASRRAVPAAPRPRPR